MPRTDAVTVDCTMLTRDGQPCGKSGEKGLPQGICAEHAIAVFRAVTKLVDVTRGSLIGPRG